MNPGRFSLLWELLSVFQGDPWPRQPLLAWKRLDLVIRSSSRAIPGLRSGFRSSELPEGSGLQDKFRAEFLCFPRVVVVVGFFFFPLSLIFPMGIPRALQGIGCGPGPGDVFFLKLLVLYQLDTASLASCPREQELGVTALQESRRAASHLWEC